MGIGKFGLVTHGICVRSLPSSPPMTQCTWPSIKSKKHQFSLERCAEVSVVGGESRACRLADYSINGAYINTCTTVWGNEMDLVLHAEQLPHLRLIPDS